MAPWLLLAPALAATSPTEIPDPRDSDAWIVDQAEVIPAEEEAALNAELLSVLRQKGVEVIVVTLDTVEGDPAEFANELFRTWSPGRVNQDRGVLIVLVEDSKALMVNAGIGLMADLTTPGVSFCCRARSRPAWPPSGTELAPRRGTTKTRPARPRTTARCSRCGCG